MRQDGEDRLAPRTLNAPDGHPTQAYTHIMGVTRQAPTPITGGLMLQLEAEGQKEGEDALEKRLAIAQELKVGGFVLEIDSESPVFAGLASCVAHESPSGQIVVADDDPRWRYDCTMARGSRRVSGLHH